MNDRNRKRVAFTVVVAGGMFASALAAATSMSAANPIERALVERDAAIDCELAEISDAKTLRARTDAFRAAFSQRVGYDALDRSPRSAKVTGRRDYGDFRVEKLLFESAPSCFVTGLLYLPDETRFKPPYAAYLFSPGHSDQGKASEDYIASCVLGARNGLAALAIDPIGQGERLQCTNLETLHRKCAEEHSRIGHYAMLLGKTTMNYMLRDAAAALDVLASRPDIDSNRLAAAGCSGGATLTTFLSVVEPRLKAVAPCCYVSSARASLLACGPQDCEQNFHDWGSFGFNHAMMVLSNERPFLIAASEKDFFPFAGTLSTYALVTNLAVRCGFPADRFALNVVPGPHAIPKPSREAIVAFFLRHLKGVVTTVIEREAPKFTEEDCRVTPEGSVLKLPGARSIYAEIESELAKRGELFAKGVLKGAERVAMDPFAVNAERRGWRGYCILNGEAWAQECYLAGLVDPSKFDPRPFLPRLHCRARFSPTEFFVPSAHRTATETRLYPSDFNNAMNSDADITAFGARTDAAPAANAAAIQKAIDAAAAVPGGGRVVVPAGEWVSGTIWLKSNVELHLEKGAVLKASPNLADYNREDAYPENWGCPKSEYWRGFHFIICRCAENVAITGEGTIHGNGDVFFDEKPIRYFDWMTPTATCWWNGIRWSKDKVNLRPGQLVVFIKCGHLLVNGITIRNAPCWSMFFHGCRDVTVRNYTVRNGHDDGNTDGIDIDCCQNVLLEDLDIDTGDDAVTVRGAGKRLRLDPEPPCENVIVRRAKLKATSSVFRIGVGAGTIRNVTVEDVTSGRGGTAINLNACYGSRETGGVDMENIVFRRCRFDNCREAYNIHAAGKKQMFGIRNVIFEDVSFPTNIPRHIGADAGNPAPANILIK